MSNLLQALEEEVRYCEGRLQPEVPTAEIFENRTDRLRLYLLYIKARIKSLKEGEEFWDHKDYIEAVDKEIHNE